MSWLLLIGAGILEMLCVTMMNQFQKDQHVKWILFIAAGFSLSFLMLSLAMNTIPMGTAYAIWTGIGAAGGAIVGMLFYGESKDAKRIFFIALILSAAVGLKIIE
ncbi:multidrug efflux SMR transporter [Bacillus safensis]|uniref:DMT family transporter n=1 Tax=Bacillus safensis TaxID=561879 RepID=UPI002281C98D|nr:multidrug efflux SMR transporter [Bacillus safensis]MCY7709913.1 multidrug efflux SMR transporter [Bacillus safensis]MCY7729054.1 multidrug efflux SMR transporter [Bacillus safensis]MED0883722.1 multidrug efflux SMR transporter [Bacillus safensis]MED0917411.1 multidrug efflux SMR transporter [Bacillus safensis]